jgi:hypothetical protein
MEAATNTVGCMKQRKRIEAIALKLRKRSVLKAN